MALYNEYVPYPWAVTSDTERWKTNLILLDLLLIRACQSCCSALAESKWRFIHMDNCFQEWGKGFGCQSRFTGKHLALRNAIQIDNWLLRSHITKRESLGGRSVAHNAIKWILLSEIHGNKGLLFCISQRWEMLEIFPMVQKVGGRWVADRVPGPEGGAEWGPV